MSSPAVPGDRHQPEGAERLEHVPALDGLRGLAVAVVLWFHAGHLTGGYLGVDLFFTLSGYLITTLIVIEWRGTGGVALRSFWARRIRRLVPAMVVMLVAVGLLGQFRVLPAARGDLRDAGLATLAYVANWWSIAQSDGYWAQTLTPSWLAHTWSLSIEEQFYVLWPLLAVAVLVGVWSKVEARSSRSKERRVRLLGTVALAGAALSAIGMIVASLAGASIERLYLGTDTRAAAILLGAAAACFQRAGGAALRLPDEMRRVLSYAAVACLVALGLAWLTLSGTSAFLYRGGLLACGLAATVVILDVTTPGRSLVAHALSLPPLRFLGTISYGLYLYHWPIFRLLGESDLPLRGWNLTFARVSLSLIAAIVSYRFVERPIVEQRWRWPMVAAAPAGIAVAVLALLITSIGAVDISPTGRTATRPALGQRSAASTQPVVTEAVDQTEETVPVPTVTLVDPVVLVVGDSVAFLLAEDGLVPQQADLGLTTVNGAVTGCTIMRDIGAEPPPGASFVRNCSDEWPALVKEYKPDVVVLLFGAYGGLDPVPVDGTDVFPCERAYDARWQERLEGAVADLSAEGAVVDLVTAPTGPLVPEDRASFNRRQGCINRVLRSVAEESSDAELIDLADWLCPDDDCRVYDGEHVLRPDGLHFAGEGAKSVARWVAPQILTVEAGP